MSWHTGRLACFDVESSGVDPHRDRIVSAALIEVGGGQKTVTHTWLLDPVIPIPDGATTIHGITTDHARLHGQSAYTGVHEIAEMVASCTQSGIPVVGFNVVYDLTMLCAELVRHGHDQLAHAIRDVCPVVDVYVLDKHVDAYRKGSRKLVDAARHYGVALSDDDAHGAAADALAAGRIAWKIAHTNRALAANTLPELHAAQVAWKREQADSFGAYLVKQGKPDDVSREWPVQSPPPGWTPQQMPIVREEAIAS